MHPRIISVLAALTIGASAAALANGPPYDVVISGTHVLVRAYTDATKWRCNYAVTAQFIDGTSSSYGSQTDPVWNAHPVTAADVNFGKPVRSAAVTRWDCTVIGYD